MPLERIREILMEPNFDVAGALEGHREDLQHRIARLERLVSTVDDTIQHLKGHKIMDGKQFFKGLSAEEEAEMEREAQQQYDPETVKASYRKWRSHTAAEKQRILDEGNAVYAAFLEAMPKGAGSPEAQAAAARWHTHMQHFWSPNDEQLLGLADLYNDDPRFKANYDRVDPGLAAFVREAIKVYVEGRRKG